MTSLLRDPAKRRYYAPLALCLLLIVILMAIPTGFEGALQYREADRCAARVLAVDDSAIIDTGLPVAVLAHGLNAEVFSGYYDNTQVYYKLADMLGVQ